MASANKTNRPIGGETAVRTLLFDVESSPNIGYTWGKWEQNVMEFVREGQIFCFSWKWLHEKETHVLALPDFPGYKRNKESNRELIKRLHELFSRAHIIVGHNIDKFDDRMSNNDFIKNGFPPPPPHKTVDTLKVARAKFRFNSNSLDDLGQTLGLGRKIRNRGIALWIDCLRGDRKSWAEMKAYNRGDVDLLEKIYLKFRPWMTNHPNVNSLDNHVGCPVCKSIRIICRGWRIKLDGRFKAYSCKDCGKNFQEVKAYTGFRFK